MRDDVRIEAQMRRMVPAVHDTRNIVKHLLSVLGTEQSEIPEVDFLVDNFDRTGKKGMGYYWFNPGAFSVIQGVGAVGVAGAFSLLDNTDAGIGLPQKTLRNWIVDDINANSINGVTVSGVQSGGQLARYKARLSSDDFTVQAKFTVPNAQYLYNDGDAVYGGLTQALALAASFDNDELGGVLAALWGEHSYNGAGDRVRQFLSMRSFVTSDDGSSIAQSGMKSLSYDYEYVDYTDPTPIMVLGENILQMVFSGNSVTYILNGTTVFSDATGTFAKGRSVGMMAFAAVGLIAGSYGAAPPAITNFKAWIAGSAEPPDGESGHGNENDGAFDYIDLYHDEDGNYDPLATED